MVVLSAAVTTKSGKPLLSRQFVSINRIRIESLLAAFSKLLGTNSQQHTFIENDNIRYVYYPVDQFYVVLITNKQSNIMEDLDTLRLLARILPSVTNGAQTEEEVTEHSFELIFAIDEVITMGMKENVSLEQIQKFTEMDSHEEKLQKIIQESKFNEAREEAKRKAKAIHKQKEEMKKVKNASGGGANNNNNYQKTSTGYDNDSSSSSSSYSSYNNYSSSDSMNKTYKNNNNKKPSSSSRGKGMQLGKSKSNKNDSFFNALSKEDNLSGPRTLTTASSTTGGSSTGLHHGGGGSDKVKISIEEKLNLVLEKEGGIKKFDLKGEMKITVFDPDNASIAIHTAGGCAKSKGFKCRLHPKIDSSVYEEQGILRLKDHENKSFPIGSTNAPTILRWRLQSKEEEEVPFTVNVWPTVEDGRSVVSVEYEHCKEQLSFTNVVISIPCPPSHSSEPPEVAQVDGDYQYDHKNKCVLWHIDEISSNSNSGSLEFSVPEIDDDDFFPVSISFNSKNTYSSLSVTGVTSAKGSSSSSAGDEQEYDYDVELTTDSFLIE